MKIHSLDGAEEHSFLKQGNSEIDLNKCDVRYAICNLYCSHLKFCCLELERELQPAESFTRPFVVELMDARFDKTTSAGYFTLRFPQVLKIHKYRFF